ncbi:hypothetical protein KHA80_22615 [Anaerobacillus sp. HL2]|nr:hypothetical protein KHA80_22615 [Anaerobacillus sp. HL2]
MDDGTCLIIDVTLFQNGCIYYEGGDASDERNIYKLVYRYCLMVVTMKTE